jgi:DNA-binding response OmpR family regulator
MTNSPAVSQDQLIDAGSPAAREAAPVRRALLVSETEVARDLEDRLSAAGLSVVRAAAHEALRAVKGAEPSVVLLAFGTRDGESSLLTLARRLRSDFSTLAVPVVFLFREDGRTLRSAAEHLGADDYFSESTAADEIRARLDALFWRVGAARRSAPALAEQRNEIDNFIFLLDAVGADLAEGLAGTVALVEAADGGSDTARALREAHAFLKLNLRRADAVAFYGPTTLVAYLPGAEAAAARATLSRLREEFRAARAGADLLAGLAAFPEGAAEVETLVERAEAALAAARDGAATERVRVYGEETTQLGAHETVGPAEETRRGVAPVAGGGVTARGAVAAGGSVVTGGAARPPEIAGGTTGHGTSLREAAEAPSPEEFRPRRSTLRRLMLVISDAARMAQVNLLMRSASYEVRAAFDGSHALNLLRIDTPDVLLLDYELHGMSGAEMLHRLRQQAGGGRLPPTVMLVPAGREEARREASEVGALTVVELPYDPVELLDALAAADRREE